MVSAQVFTHSSVIPCTCYAAFANPLQPKGERFARKPYEKSDTVPGSPGSASKGFDPAALRYITLRRVVGAALIGLSTPPWYRGDVCLPASIPLLPLASGEADSDRQPSSESRDCLCKGSGKSEGSDKLYCKGFVSLAWVQAATLLKHLLARKI